MPEKNLDGSYKKLQIQGIVAVAIVGAVVFVSIGYLWGNNNTNTTATSTRAIPSPHSDVVGTSTSDWETYTDDTYGFSFKYPKDWIRGEKEWQDEMVVGISLTSPQMQEFIREERPDSSPEIYIKAITKPANFSLRSIIENDADYKKDSISQYTIAESTGYSATFDGMIDDYSVFWENDNYYFEASTFGSTEDMDNILATFQFTK